MQRMAGGARRGECCREPFPVPLGCLLSCGTVSAETLSPLLNSAGTHTIAAHTRLPNLLEDLILMSFNCWTFKAQVTFGCISNPSQLTKDMTPEKTVNKVPG